MTTQAAPDVLERGNHVTISFFGNLLCISTQKPLTKKSLSLPTQKK
jgi:hypothetical protein